MESSAFKSDRVESLETTKLVSVPLPGIESLDELGLRTQRKISRRLLPFLCVLYIVAYLDRANIAFAKLSMSAQVFDQEFLPLISVVKNSPVESSRNAIPNVSPEPEIDAR